jgi:shikimate dehydrogenase
VRRKIWFVGVSTAGSAALAAFPAWARSLCVEADLLGVDLAKDSTGDTYRQLVTDFRHSREVIGAVITGHKARLFETVREQLDAVDDAARGCREISVLYRNGDCVCGTAVEVRSSRAVLSEIAPERHWATTHGELLMLGAGGTAASLISALFHGRGAGSGVPSAVHLIDLVRPRAELLAECLTRVSSGTATRIYSVERASLVLSRLPSGSLVVNATGVGKDIAGSPVPLPARWPREGIFWELNYRGELPLLRDAIRQARARGLAVHDGWKLFVAGWSEALAAILNRQLTNEELAAIERASLVARAS